MRFNFKLVLGWTGIMLLGQLGYNMLGLTWIWDYDFTGFWITTYIAIIPLGIISGLRNAYAQNLNDGGEE